MITSACSSSLAPSPPPNPPDLLLPGGPPTSRKYPTSRRCHPPATLFSPVDSSSTHRVRVRSAVAPKLASRFPIEEPFTPAHPITHLLARPRPTAASVAHTMPLLSRAHLNSTMVALRPAAKVHHQSHSDPHSILRGELTYVRTISWRNHPVCRQLRPAGWAFCQGQLLSIAQNTALFSLLGTTLWRQWANTFALPDLRGRVPVGTAKARACRPYNLGELAGEPTHTLIITEMPAHNHPAQAAGHRQRRRQRQPQRRYLGTSTARDNRLQQRRTRRPYGGEIP